MSKFLNIPDEAEKIILESPNYASSEVYRGIRHKETLEKTDFCPTFDDPYVLHERDVNSIKGEMARIVVSKSSVSNYSVSLYTSLSSLNKHLRRKDFLKKKFPSYAVGPTNSDKGYSVLGKDGHIDYYLYDYKGNNPVNEFVRCDFNDYEE